MLFEIGRGTEVFRLYCKRLTLIISLKQFCFVAWIEPESSPQVLAPGIPVVDASALLLQLNCYRDIRGIHSA